VGKDNLIQNDPEPLEDKYFRDIRDSENISNRMLRIEMSKKESRNESNGDKIHWAESHDNKIIRFMEAADLDNHS
jgi:hypothetical protein